MPGSFDRRIALVTGGGGIGRATAFAFAGEGAKLVIADFSEDAGDRVAREIVADGGEAVFVRTDVYSADDVAVSTYGRLDCAFNNAGIGDLGLPLHEITEEHWDHLLAANLKSVWLCMKYEIPQMRAQGGGANVNTASQVGLFGKADAAAYVASKHGIVGLTRAAALENAAEGIRVNAVCPGIVDTGMGRKAVARDSGGVRQAAAGSLLGRAASPDEVAAGVLWLSSDTASFVTGIAMPIDAGATAR
ncbi:MAG TPA: SDR family oxidoreductase [Chloroflexota bacterium]|nr:SDR family oxidoreductase [Chloroflexota bacterium]